jgi:hypothetical protein
MFFGSKLDMAYAMAFRNELAFSIDKRICPCAGAEDDFIGVEYSLGFRFDADDLRPCAVVN